jgi:Skp family chaperone for outer membrane proteins
MRPKALTTSILLTFLCLSAIAKGQAMAPAQKIGIINIQAAIATTAEGKKAFGDLQKKYQPRQADLQRQQQEIQNLQDQLQRQQQTLSDAERVRLSRELSDKQKLFERAREDAQADFQEDRQDVISRVGQKMIQIIEDYSKQNGFSLVFDAQVPIFSGNQSTDAQIPIYYASDDVNIIEEIVKRYDAAFPVQNAAGDAPKPPAKPADKPKP